MKKVIRYSHPAGLAVRFFLPLYIAVDTYLSHRPFPFLIYLCVIYLLFNEIVANYLYGCSLHEKTVSRIMQNFGAAFLLQYMLVWAVLFFVDNNGNVNTLYYFFLEEILDRLNGKRVRFFLGFHASCFFCSLVLREIFVVRQPVIVFLPVALTAIISYLVILFVFGVIHFYKNELRRQNRINLQLVENSFRERDLIIAREREQMSQELHDSFGHSLVSILMNVQYLEAIKDKSAQERDHEISNINMLVEESLAELRKSVDGLKQIDSKMNLLEEVEQMTVRLNHLQAAKIVCNLDNNIEFAPSKIKHILFKTIREGVTNSLKHGEAAKIIISLKIFDGEIRLSLKDNGIGSTTIQESDGLKGIRNRVDEIGGETMFETQKGKGFSITIFIPWGGIPNDTGNDSR